MESPTRIPNIEPPYHHQLSCSTGRKRSDSICASPEFEFWMVRNPSFPQPNLHSADELFVDGILRPLHLLHLQHHPQPEPEPESKPEPGSQISPASIAAEAANTTTLTSSKRWKDIFKKSATTPSTTTNSQQENRDRDKEKQKEKKREKKVSNGVNTSSSSTPELSIINIWPFSRSRSAGNNGSRPRMFGGASATRKASSAPCSRSNSSGESKSRKWPSSPSRSGGVHLGRSSPVWQLRHPSDHNKSDQSRRSAAARTSAIASGGDGNKGRVLNFNVPNMCISYGHHLSCRSDENSGGGVRGGRYGGRRDRGSTTHVGGHGGGNLFNLRGLFSSKKIH